jgi:hypothetical protein
MPRTVSPAMLAQVESGQCRPARFVEIAFLNDTVWLWSGVGNISSAGPAWDPEATFPYGQTFIGVGWLGAIQSIPQVSDIVAENISLLLSGIPLELLGDAINACRQNSTVTIWDGVLDQNGNIVPDPVQVFLGALDVPTHTADASSATISITAENPLVDLNRAPSRRYTDIDQQTDFPGDSGFFQVQLLQDYNVVWPSPIGTSVTTPAPNYLTPTPGAGGAVIVLVPGQTQPMSCLLTNADGTTEIVAGPGCASNVGCDWESTDPTVAVPVGDGEGPNAGITGVAPGMCVITMGFVQGRGLGGGTTKPSNRITASVTVIVTEAPA